MPPSSDWMTCSREEGITLPVPVDTSESSNAVARDRKRRNHQRRDPDDQKGSGMPTRLLGEFTGIGGILRIIIGPPPPPAPTCLTFTVIF